MRMVYVVMGETGEYSDHCDWPVLAFDTEEMAQTFVTNAEKWLREHDLWRRSGYIDIDYDQQEALLRSCPFDPDVKTDYTGTRYLVMPVKFAE